jgi:hypothetical protein
MQSVRPTPPRQGGRRRSREKKKKKKNKKKKKGGEGKRKIRFGLLSRPRRCFGLLADETL